LHFKFAEIVMGTPGWVIPAIIVGLAVAVLVSALSHFIAGRFGHGARHGVFGLILAVVGGAGLLLGLNTVMYARLTHEGPVAEITVKALDPAQNRYTVLVKRLDSDIPVQSCAIQGDEWLIAGKVQKWKPWANMIGLDATYTLDQVINKYFTAARGNGKLITACDLTDSPPDANKYVPPAWVQWLEEHSFTQDRRFGDANFMPLADGAVYKLLITQSGFNTEAENDVAKTAVAKQI
jgi:hypothetical protein